MREELTLGKLSQLFAYGNLTAMHDLTLSSIFNLANLLILVMIGILIAFGAVVGFRLHMAAVRYTLWAQRLPADTGAWIGLLLGAAWAAHWLTRT